MNKIIKISCADSTKSWFDHRNPMIFKFLPGGKNIWKNCEFFWNDVKINKADYWVIFGDADLNEEVCEVAPNNVIFMTGEPESIKRYDVSKGFINQFGRVFTSQRELKHAKTFPLRPPINWWIDGGSPIKSKEEFQNWQGDGLGYDDFKNLCNIKKDRLISVFCSNKTFTEGHKMRFNFCKKLKLHFKDKLDWFGNGVNPIKSKIDGIAPYKYHIALENSSGPDYITEKLLDPLMVLTHPIYYGAPNVGKYFNESQVTPIDIRYPRLAIAKIEKLISENFYEKNFKQFLKARDLVMDKYNFYNLICEIVENDERAGISKEKSQIVKIKKEQFFLLKTASVLIKRRKNL